MYPDYSNSSYSILSISLELFSLQFTFSEIIFKVAMFLVSVNTMILIDTTMLALYFVN